MAGGTGSVGKTIVEVLEEQGKHDIYVFSRGKSSPASSSGSVHFIKTDYADVSATTKVLEDTQIDTIVSAITIESEATSKSQLALIEAADRAETVKRFIPSEYGFLATPESVKLDSSFQYWIDNIEALKKTGLEYTRIPNGWFSDYWGLPHIKSHMPPYPWALDIATNRAAIPGSGDDLLSMTYTFDVARVIAKLLDTPNWPDVVAISGQDLSFNHLLKIAEDAKGAKFEVTHDDKQKLEKGEATVLGDPTPGMQAYLSLFGLLLMQGDFLMPKGVRADQLFPDLKLLSVDKMIKDCWSRS